MNTQHTPIPFIRSLLADKTEEDIKEAEERFLALIDLAKRIYKRTQAEYDLTASPKND